MAHQAHTTTKTKAREPPVPLRDAPDFGFHPLLAKAVADAPTYRSRVRKLMSVSEVVDEIYEQVDNVEPFKPVAVGLEATARSASVAFCLLWRLFELRPTETQLREMVVHEDSPFIRAVAALFVRYGLPADSFLTWLGPLLQDEEEFTPTAAKAMPMCEWVKSLITDNRYCGTILPRVPVMAERAIRAALAAPSSSSSSSNPAETTNTTTPTSAATKSDSSTYKKGDVVRAKWSEDGQWYDARVEEPGDKPHTWWVTYLPEEEYGNQEQVDEKDMEVSSSLAAAVASRPPPAPAPEPPTTKEPVKYDF